MAFIRRIKKKSGIYLAKVESYRKEGKVKQRVIKYLGKEIDGEIVRRVKSSDIGVEYVKRSLDIMAIDKVADELGIKEIRDKNILALVYSQLMGNRTINKMGEWLRFSEIPEVLGIGEVNSIGLYNSLSYFDEEEFKVIERRLKEFFMSIEGSNRSIVIDVSDTYFEGDSLEIESRRGKDGKVKKLRQFCIATTFKEGFPLLYSSYQGNLSNINIMKDMGMKLGKEGCEMVVMDRGMSSIENIKMLKSLGIKIICGLRKNNKLIDIIKGIRREEIYRRENRLELKSGSVYIKGIKDLGGEIIIVYNPQLEIYRNEQAFEKGIDIGEKLYGYSLIYHDTDLVIEEVVKRYYEKDIIERAFKQMKGVIGIRPVRVWLREHIENHFRICYLAYAILSYINYKLEGTGISGKESLEILKQGYKVRLVDKSSKDGWDLWVPLEPKGKEILKKLGVVYKT